MSYAQQKINLFEVAEPANNDLITTGVKGRIIPGMHPITVRGIYAYITEVGATTDPVVTVKKRITPGSDTGAVTIGTLTWPVATAIGTLVYKSGLQVLVKPGEEIVFDVTTATATTGECIFGVEADPAWEHPANNTKMLASA